MKTEFDLDYHVADLIGSKIRIIGEAPEHKPYVSISIGEKGPYLFIEDKDLERFAVNILKSLKSNKLK